MEDDLGGEQTTGGRRTTSEHKKPPVREPAVERVRPGLWSIPLPLPFAGSLRHVLIYALETSRGPYLIDAGWDSPETLEALARGLAIAGFTLSEVRGVLVTHMHADHYGLAGAVREASGAWIALGRADAALLRELQHDGAYVDRAVEDLRRAGLPESQCVREREALSVTAERFVSYHQPDLLLDDGDRAEVPGWDLVALATPGHSPGHLCFYETAKHLAFVGDHVLPRITPHIGGSLSSRTRALGDYLHSLERVGALEVSEVLPAHEQRFRDLSARTEEIAAHHERRLAEMLDVIAGGEPTAFEVAQALAWSKPWAAFEPFATRLAISETVAHLAELVARGLVRGIGGVPERWGRLEAR